MKLWANFCEICVKGGLGVSNIQLDFEDDQLLDRGNFYDVRSLHRIEPLSTLETFATIVLYEYTTPLCCAIYSLSDFTSCNVK